MGPTIPHAFNGRRRNRSELSTTLTLEKAIAPAASIGDKSPAAAMGIATTV
jgi:hypothetical protein